MPPDGWAIGAEHPADPQGYERGTAISALQSKNLLEILAEPNVLAINGKSASFVAGGEFPYPTLQGGGAGLGAVTIAFREFGVRLQFLPTVTPRGTIRLQVMPEVSSLDFAHGLTFQGFSIPALATRRIQTEIELESGQTFVIAGLLDNETTDNMSKIPGLSAIPLLGKLFTTKSVNRQNSELMVLVTPGDRASHSPRTACARDEVSPSR